MNSIVNNILPGNYWLSKSMEFVKIESSGTLWYLKKYLVCYYYVLLKKELFEDDYAQIANIFNDYIQSLPPIVQQDAEEFFFKIDIRTNTFTKLNQFIETQQSFSNENEKIKFVIKAKRFYFQYLLGIGGQSKFKKRTKELIEGGRSYEETTNIVKQEMLKEGHSLSKYKTDIESDFPAALRNERQIFFYYGFFHGSESSDLSGFYNLTSIGKAVLKANFLELLIIWEHQKLKMISQSPVAKIDNLSNPQNKDSFSILNNPYFTLLNILSKKNEITSEQYQYVISKITNYTDQNIIENEVLGNTENEKIFVEKALSFNRSGEIATEDFTKEIKKFILGICELPKDREVNPLSSITWPTGGKIEIKNHNKFNFLFSIYTSVNKYLCEENNLLYESFNASLKESYKSFCTNNVNPLSDDIKYEWYKYIINFDSNVVINLLYAIIAAKKNILNFEIGNTALKSEFENFKNIALVIGLKKKDFGNLLIEVQTKLKENSYYKLPINDEIKYGVIDPRKIQKDISLEKLLQISSISNGQNDINVSMNRIRNSVLIDSLKSYYFTNYINPSTKEINCDCCAEPTFITYNETPYLEFHHVIPFAEKGPDHYLNLIGICPNCHRKIHFAKQDAKVILYQNASQNNNLKLSLIHRINELFIQGFIEPIHLDYLKKEKIITTAQYETYMSNQVIAA